MESDTIKSLPWMKHAECAQLDIADKDKFLPDSIDDPNYEFCVSVCDRCDVKKQCLEYAKATEGTVGVWGGVLFVEKQQDYSWFSLAESVWNV